MLKRHHRFFQSMQILRDALLVAVAFYVAHRLRFAFPQWVPYDSVSDARETLVVGMMLVGLWPVVAWASGLYLSHRTRGYLSDWYDVLRVTLLAFLVLVTLTYFVRDVRFSRGTLLLWMGLNFFFVGVGRMGARMVLRQARVLGYNLRHVLVVGEGPLAQQVVRTLERQHALGLRVMGVLSTATQSDASHVEGAPVLGSAGTLPLVLARGGVDQVILALPIHRLGVLTELMNTLSRETVDVRLVPDFHQYVTLCGGMDELAGMPILNLQATPLVGWSLVLKRFFDVSMGLLAMALATPLMGLIALAVRASGPGPVFYRQERVGMDGRRFTMLKFRTMRVDAEAAGAQMTLPNDPRRTVLGAFLRRTSLDELPQLWNVVRGDMSLVGPRPERPCFIDELKREIPRYALRHKIKAGMTGWAQINGMRGNTSIEKRIELDLYYIENWSLALDLKILLRTVLGGFLSPNAY